jgi:hypothetical protein
MCNYLVYCPDAEGKRAADATALQLLPRIGTYDTDSAHYSMFGGSCENLSQAEQVLARLRSLYKAGTVRLAIVREIFIIDGWLDGLMRMQTRPAPGPTSRARVR